MNDVLVTGHRGFVGREVVRHLRAQGLDVGVLETSDGGPIRLGEKSTVSEIIAHCGPASAIVHCAADLRRGADYTACIRTNCLGVEQLLDVAGQWRASRLVFISTGGVYAPSSEPLGEDAPVAPRDTYTASKLFGEHRVLAGSAGRCRAICFRIPSPVGPGMPENRLLTRWVRCLQNGEPPDLLGAGSKVQHYVDVRDIARGVECALLQREVTGVFNLAGPEAVSNLQLAELCIAALRPGLAVERVPRPDPDDSLRCVYRTEKIQRALGFEPRYPLAESITALAKELENPAHR